MKKLILILLVLCLPLLCAQQETYIPNRTSSILSAADCSIYTAEGFACIDSDTGVLYIGDGTTANPSNLKVIYGTTTADIDTSGTNCLQTMAGSGTSMSACNVTGNNSRLTDVPFDDGLTVFECVVYCYDCDFDTAGDKQVLQLRYYDWVTPGFTNLGPPIAMVDTDPAPDSVGGCDWDLSGVTTVTAAAPGNTYTLAAGNFTGGGLYVGAEVTWSGFTDPANNGTKTITVLAGGVMTVSETLVAEAAVANTSYVMPNCIDDEGTITATINGTTTTASGIFQILSESTGVDGGGAEEFPGSISCMYY